MIPRERIDRARAIPLAHVLQEAQARRDREDPCRWHTGRGPVSVTGVKFYNWHDEQGGGGAIDLVIHLFGLSFIEAVVWLEKMGHGASCAAPVAIKDLSLPKQDARRLAAVKTYLVGHRGLTPLLIDHLVAVGDLYADPYAHAVFIMRNAQGVVIGAELRGTRGTWRGLAPGSKKDQGFFSIQGPAFEEIILCEAAIDAISCFMLKPGRWCISTAGARANPIWLKALPSPLLCGFDADAMGDLKARQMIQAHPHIKRLRPPQKDWNDTLVAQPTPM